MNLTNLSNAQTHEFGRLLAAEQAQADGAPEVSLMILAGTVYVASRRQAAGAWQLGGWGRKHTTGTAAVVFADLSGDRPSFRVVPSWWLRLKIDADREVQYPDGIRPVNPDSQHVGIWPRDIAEWGGDWRGAYTAAPFEWAAGCAGLEPEPQR
jgi:hypothetical protein